MEFNPPRYNLARQSIKKAIDIFESTEIMEENQKNTNTHPNFSNIIPLVHNLHYSVTANYFIVHCFTLFILVPYAF